MLVLFLLLGLVQEARRSLYFGFHVPYRQFPRLSLTLGSTVHLEPERRVQSRLLQVTRNDTLLRSHVLKRNQLTNFRFLWVESKPIANCKEYFTRMCFVRKLSLMTESSSFSKISTGASFPLLCFTQPISLDDIVTSRGDLSGKEYECYRFPFDLYKIRVASA